MQILVLILGTVLLPKGCVTTPQQVSLPAFALKCYECTSELSESCPTTECPPSTQCGSIRFISFAGSSEFSDVKMRICAVAEQCVNGSVNFGFATTVITSSCCSSDLCNFQDAPDYSMPSPNGKKCFTCDGRVCNQTLNCTGNEDYCISTKVKVGQEKLTVKGCTSKLICSGLQSAQTTRVFAGKASCCQGDLCNSATSTTTSILLLVAPLICQIWFS